MADIRFVVAVDDKGSPVIKKLDTYLKELGISGAEAGDKVGGAWKQFALGQMVVDGVRAVYRGAVREAKDWIAAAASQEKQDNALRAALMATGRTVEGNLQHYKAAAAEIQNMTVYSDDAVQEAQALMLSLVDLDQKGIDRATKAAAGMATVFGMDLHAAATLVGKAMAGNTAMLSRYGIKISENLTLEQKREAILSRLGQFYAQSEQELNSFSGAVAHLKNQWGEAQEEIGNAVVKNESIRKTIMEVEGVIREMMPQLKEFAAGVGQLIADIAGFAVDAIKWIEKVRQSIGGMDRPVSDQAAAWDKLAAKFGGFSNAVNSINLAILTTGQYSAQSRELVAGLGDRLWQSFNEVGERETYAAIAAGNFGEEVKKAFAIVGGEALKVAISFNEPKKGINETGRSADSLATKLEALGIKGGPELRAQLELATKALEEMKAAAGDEFPGVLAALEKKVQDLKEQLYGVANAVESAVVKAFKQKAPLQPIPITYKVTTDGGQLPKKNYGPMIEQARQFQAENASAIRSAQELEQIWTQAMGNMMSQSIAWGETTGSILTNAGNVFKNFVKEWVMGLELMAIKEMMLAAKTVAAEKMKAAAKYIASIFSKVPFPFNLALAAGAFAVINALFAKILKFREGGVFTKPTIAEIGHGTEYVLPEKKLVKLVQQAILGPVQGGRLRPATAGGPTVNIYVQTLDATDFLTVTRRKIIPILQRQLTHNQGVL